MTRARHGSASGFLEFQVFSRRRIQLGPVEFGLQPMEGVAADAGEAISWQASLSSPVIPADAADSRA